MTPEVKALPSGTLVTLIDANSEYLGVATFNPHSLICGRVLSRNWKDLIDKAFLASRLNQALALRETLFSAPHYRLVHAEADGLPGVIVDRFGDVLTVQVNTAGIERLTPLLIEALVDIFSPRAIVLRNDSPVRQLEGLTLDHRLAQGELDGPVELVENGCRFVADLLEGQKTGWFFDQRDNRAFVAQLAAGKRMLDVYTYAGGFAIQGAVAGATEVTAIDRSEAALAMVSRSAELNRVHVTPRRAEAFAEMARLAEAKERFGMVVVDPPAFVKSRKDLRAGTKGYQKMARMAAQLVEPNGFLFCASCSHHMPVTDFTNAIAAGLNGAGRSGRILRAGGAGADHPVHPWLPESAYLKSLILQLD